MQFSSCQAKERIWQQCSYSYCNLADTFDCNRVYLLQRISPCSIIFQPDLRKCDYFRSWGFKLWFVGEKKHEGPPLKLTLRGMQADHVKTYKWDHTKFVSAFIPLRVSFRGGPSCFFFVNCFKFAYNQQRVKPFHDISCFSDTLFLLFCSEMWVLNDRSLMRD